MQNVMFNCVYLLLKDVVWKDFFSSNFLPQKKKSNKQKNIFLLINWNNLINPNELFH